MWFRAFFIRKSTENTRGGNHKTFNMMSVLSLFCTLAVIHCTQGASPQLLGKFPYKHAAFSSLYKRTDGPGYDLLLSSFSPFGSDVSIVTDIGKSLSDISNIKTQSISTEMKWPNQISGVPSKVFNSTTARYIAIPDGFLVPTKGKGSITLYELDGQTAGPLTITGRGEDWFYHLVQWVDMDKDGDLDALTARANEPIFGSHRAQLVWFTNPPTHSVQTPWKENVIGNDPDVYFELANLTVSGGRTYEAIFVAQFFTPGLRVYWTEDPKQNWSHAAGVKSRDIDMNIGKAFCVLVSDVNGDRKPDLVVTTNSDTNGTVLLYQIPDDFRTGTYTRHLLADGYKSQSSGMGKGGPGSAYIMPDSSSQKPSILISGDDSAVASLFTPSSPSSPQDWTYTRNDFLQAGSSTVGALCFADVDGDNKTELFAPLYNDGFVYVYRFV